MKFSYIWYIPYNKKKCVLQNNGKVSAKTDVKVIGNPQQYILQLQTSTEYLPLALSFLT